MVIFHPPTQFLRSPYLIVLIDQQYIMEQAKALPFCSSRRSWFCPYWWRTQSFVDKWGGNLNVKWICAGIMSMYFWWKMYEKKHEVSFQTLFAVVSLSEPNVKLYPSKSYFSLYLLFLLVFIPFQANKDAARFPVAARVAELLIRGVVSLNIVLVPFIDLRDGSSFTWEINFHYMILRSLFNVMCLIDSTTMRILRITQWSLLRKEYYWLR